METGFVLVPGDFASSPSRTGETATSDGRVFFSLPHRILVAATQHERPRGSGSCRISGRRWRGWFLGTFSVRVFRRHLLRRLDDQGMDIFSTTFGVCARDAISRGVASESQHAPEPIRCGNGKKEAKVRRVIAFSTRSELDEEVWGKKTNGSFDADHLLYSAPVGEVMVERGDFLIQSHVSSIRFCQLEVRLFATKSHEFPRIHSFPLVPISLGQKNNGPRLIVWGKYQRFRTGTRASRLFYTPNFYPEGIFKRLAGGLSEATPPDSRTNMDATYPKGCTKQNQCKTKLWRVRPTTVIDPAVFLSGPHSAIFARRYPPVASRTFCELAVEKALWFA